MNFSSSIARFLDKLLNNTSQCEFQHKFQDRFNLKYLFIFLLFATLGYLGNYFRLPLFFGVDFLFGSIFVLIATYLYGITMGSMVAVIASIHTYIIWGQPYATILLILEALWVGIGIQHHQQTLKGSRNMILLVLSYWLCLGAPLCFGFYYFFLKFGINSVVLVVLKQVINGAFNALVAHLCIDYIPLFRQLIQRRQGDRHHLNIQQMLFHLLLAFVFVPVLTIAIVTGYQSLQDIENEISSQLGSSTAALSTDLKYWYQRSSQTLRELAIIGANDQQNLERFQFATTALGKVTPSFLNIYTTDGEGNILTTFPSMSDSNKASLRQSRFQKEIFQQVQSSLSIAFSDIHTDEITDTPHINVAVPILKNNRFDGIAIASLDIAQIQEFLTDESATWKVEAFLLDRHKKVISSNSPTDLSGKLFDLPQGSEIRTFKTDQFQWLPQIRGAAMMTRWRKSYYFQQVRIGGEIPWSLFVRLSPVSHIDSLEKLHTYILALILAIILPATIVGNSLSRRLVKPIAKLIRLTTNLQENLSVESDFAWQPSNLAEIDTLGYNFQVMAIALQRKFQEIEQTNQSLEIRIQERTAELQANQQRLERITDSVPGMVYQFRRDRSGNYSISYLSKGAIDIYEVTITDVYEDPNCIMGLTIPEDLDMVLASIEESARTLNKWSATYRIILPNGKLKWLSGRAIPTSHEDDSIIWNGVITDVTDLKQTELALQKSEERWQLAIQAADDGIWDVNLETGVTFRSERWRTMLGLDANLDNEYPIDWVELIHPDDRARTLQKRDDYLSRKILEYVTEYRMRYADGSYKWFLNQGQALWNEQGKAIRMIGASSDITERKFAIAALEKRESYLAMLVEIQRHLLAESISNQEYINILGLLGKVSDFSSIKLFACEQSPVNDFNEFDIKLYTHSAWYAEGVNQAEESEQQRFIQMLIDFQWIARLADGNIINESLSTVSETEKSILTSKNLHSILVMPIIVSSKFWGFLSFHDYHSDRLRDHVEISLLRVSTSSLAMHLERQQAKMEMLQAMESAQTANRAKSEFLATMSHEIRTPMNAVIGMASILLDTELNSDQQEFAEIIRSSGDNLLTIINDILDFSKIESGQFSLDIHPFDLRHCIEEALDLLAAIALNKEIELVYYIEPDVPEWIISDITRLRQILVNLLSNAVKFTAHGEVTLRVSIQEFDQSNQNYQLLFTVKDSGIGIPQERYNRLFRPFSQVDSSTTRQYGGTGLGLAIAHQLTLLMGGAMSVESTVGVGSTFTFTIFTVADKTSLVRESWSRNLVGKRLLILEDNDVNRESLTTFAQILEMEFLATNSSEQAIAWLQSEKPFDLAIVDANIPIISINENDSNNQCDSYSIQQLMRKQASALPMILLSHTFSCDFYSSDPKITCLSKPIKRSQLYNSLLKLCSNHSFVENQTKQKDSSLLDINFATRFPLRILIAEDNIVNQKVATRFLNRLGYRADVVANGIEALESIYRQNYDVILMDVHMPEMDGLTATRRIVAEFRQKPWIIALTASALQGDREICLEAGMQDYISKPIQVQDLMQALEKAYSHK
jgi:PAS domain S-box-containing protein